MQPEMKQTGKEEEFWICTGEAASRKLSDDYILGDVIGKLVPN